MYLTARPWSNEATFTSTRETAHCVGANSVWVAVVRAGNALIDVETGGSRSREPSVARSREVCCCVCARCVWIAIVSAGEALIVGYAIGSY
jgi:hypothetical protein